MTTTSTRLAAPMAGFIRVTQTTQVTLDATNPTIVGTTLLPTSPGTTPIPIAGGVSVFQGNDIDGWGLAVDHNVVVIANGPTNATGNTLDGEPFDRWDHKLTIGPDIDAPEIRVAFSATFVTFAS